MGKRKQTVFKKRWFDITSACGYVKRKKYEEKNILICILKVAKERSRIQRSIRIQIQSRIRINRSEVRIRICTKMSQIPSVALCIEVIWLEASLYIVAPKLESFPAKSSVP